MAVDSDINRYAGPAGGGTFHITVTFIQARARRFSQNFFFCFCISKSVANVCFCKPPRRERGQGREPDRCHPDANEGSEMPAGGSMFAILHHSQLVFSAEMSDQLTALPLTFNRKTAQQMQVGLTGPGPTGGLWQLLDPCFYRSAVFILSAPQEASLSSHRSTQNESFISSHFQIRLTFPDAPPPRYFPAFPPSYTDIRWAHLKRRSSPRLSSSAGAAGVSAFARASAEKSDARSVYSTDPRGLDGHGWVYVRVNIQSRPRTCLQ